MKESTKNLLPPHDTEAEVSLLNFIEKQQGKKQSVQSFIDYIPEGLFYEEKHRVRYDNILLNHKQEKRKDIPQQQASVLSDLIDLKKKRDLLRLVEECAAKIYNNKQSFKIIKGRLFAQVDSI
jgi:replicative DNA helicase